MLSLLLSTLAFAQDPVTGGDMPPINAQLFRPSVDARNTLWSDESVVVDDSPILARGLVQWMNGPLVYQRGDETTNLISNHFELDLTAAWSMGRVRVGAQIPVYLRTLSDVNPSASGLGDLALDGKVMLVDRRVSPLGVALTGRLGLPTNTTDFSLGDDKLAAELALVADKELGDLLLVANLGTKFGPNISLENFDWGDQLFARVGAGYRISDAAGASLEVNANANYASFFASNATPVEALLGGWVKPGDSGLTLRGGVGAGLTSSVGSPRARAMIGLGWEPAGKKEPAPPPVVDTDGDGLFDDVDQCVNEAEVVNGFEDADGCPDALGTVTVRVVDAKGQPVADAALMQGDQAVTLAADGSFQLVDVMPGESLSFQASAPKRKVVDAQTVQVASGEQEVRFVLDWIPARVRVKVMDVKKQPIPADLKAEATDDSGVRLTSKLDATGVGVFEVPPGNFRFTVGAEGYRVDTRVLDLAADTDTDLLEILLKPAKVTITEKELVILDKVFFDSGKATVQAKSLDLLTEVAELLVSTPQVKLVEIQGHTDSQGSDSSNLDLSQRRVDAVRQILIEKGVSADRLVSKGYGETAPIATNDTAAGRAENRRVQFVILEQQAIVREVELPVDAAPAPTEAPAAPTEAAPQ